MKQKHNKISIIEKGVGLFREKGYHNTGIGDILKSCDIPSGTFYNFFKSKEVFAIEALEHYHQNYMVYLDRFFNDKKYSPLERLRNAFQENVNGHANQSCKMGCLLNSITNEIAANNVAIQAKVTNDYRRNSQKIATIIKEGQDLGEIRIDFTADELADYIINGMSGATVRMKAGLSDAPLQLFMRTAFEFLKSKS